MEINLWVYIGIPVFIGLILLAFEYFIIQPLAKKTKEERLSLFTRLVIRIREISSRMAFFLGSAVTAIVFLIVNGISPVKVPPVPPETTMASPTQGETSHTNTNTPTSTEPPATTFTPTITLTPDPTSTATSTPPLRHPNGLTNGCVDVKYWKPYEDDVNKDLYDYSSNHGCWDFNGWGLFAMNDGLSINISTGGGGQQQRGIYISIPENVIIKFKIKVKKFEINSGLNSGFIELAIIDDGRKVPGLGHSRSVRYVYNPNEKKDLLVPRIYQDRTSYDRLNSLLNLPMPGKESFPQEVTFEIYRSRIDLFVDGQKEYMYTHDYQSYAFWIGYSIPGSASLEAEITDFIIEYAE